MSEVCKNNEEVTNKLCRVDNGPNYVEVHSTDIGYKIISYMPHRGIITSEYPNSEKYNDKSEWNLDLIVEHGHDEEDEKVNSIKEY